mmetsp:Transcript_32574/g.70970  ORF Transcript_32574/g.70970 Transcript_32574/m.70970 type:complete len:112 (+) Transcript_32574:1083-1418(+)
MQLELILDEIENENLHGDALNFERRMKADLQLLSDKYPVMTNIRGKGVTMAFDILDDGKRAEFISAQFAQGVIQGQAGTHSIRLRPILAIADKHIDIFLDKTENTLKQLML